MKLELDFKRMGWTKKNWAVVEGSIPVRPGSDKNWIISGKWTEQMSAYNEETGETLQIWKASELPPDSDQQYFFTDFAINLNHLPEEMKQIIAPTDSRFRPDQRALENGEIQKAV